MRRYRFPATFAVLLFAVMLAAPLPAIMSVATTQAQEATPAATTDGGSPVILFAAPGLEAGAAMTFAAEGALPAISELMSSSATGGLVAPVPATAGVSLPTLLTGAWPAEHGVVGDRFYRTGSPDFAEWAAWDDAGLLQADTLPQAAERAGKTVVAIGWQGVAGLDPALSGPVIGDAIAYSEAGLLATVEPPAAAADHPGITVDAAAFRPAEGWTGVPESFSPAQEAELTIRSLDAAGANPDRTFYLYVYDATDDATTNYDTVFLATAKDAASEVASVGPGAWAAAPVELEGERAGEAAGFWVQALELAPDLSEFALYYTPVSRRAATWTACADHPMCGEPGGFEEFVNEAIGPALAIDAAPLEAGIIDEATFVAQGTTSAWQGIDALRLIVEDLGVQPDLLLLESPVSEAISRQFPASLAASDAAGAATPAAAAVDGGGEREALLREGYALADRLLATGSELLGPEANILAVSTGRTAPSTMAVSAGQVLVDAGLAEADQPENCVPGPGAAPAGTPDPEALPVGPAVKACWSGATAHVYINLDGREAEGSVAEDAYDATREAIVAAFTALRDPEHPDAEVVSSVYLKEDLREIEGGDALHPSRTGDVVVTLSPPYRFDTLTDGAAIAAAEPATSDGYLLGDGRIAAAGPAFSAGATFEARAIDVAPTAAYLLGVPGPYNASGSILFDALANGPSLQEVTLLDISDFHGQLPPLSASADSIDAEGAVSSSYEVGGIAVLGPWFGRYRADASGEVLLVTAGDAVGATPPISTAFGDVPTIEAMNALGFTADSLGNHNFDAGAEYMFGTLGPIAEFPYLSANLVPARADTATPAPEDAPFQPSLLIEGEGVSVGIVGFSNPDIPNLTRPGAMDPYRVIDPVDPVNAEAARLREQGADAVIAIGHMGATSGTLTEPLGPVVDLADHLQGVDVVVGDHTDFQVSAIRPNGVLLVESRSKGVMFTRVRLVIDSETGELRYRTADFHRPWVIGITPDPETLARLEQLEAELAPTLGVVIGAGTRVIPRSDACGMETGRTCESLIGDIITDALRITYGTDFALTNSGGIRADLTCPTEGGDFCPTDGAANQITEGQVLTVLPFGNVAATLEVTGAELKEMLEVGIGHMPEASGAFPQVSGFCFTYDIEAEPGNRVTGAVRQAADGACSGEALDLTEGTTYTLSTNDFTASGGDGYPDLLARADSRDILASVVAGYIVGESPLALPGEPIDPRIEGRIVCEGDGCPVPAAE